MPASFPFYVARDRNQKLYHCGSGWQFQTPDRCLILNRFRWSLKADNSLASHVVEPLIKECKRVCLHYGTVILPAPWPSATAHLKNIDEISVVGDLHHELDLSLVEIGKCQRIEENVGRQHLPSANMQGILWQIK